MAKILIVDDSKNILWSPFNSCDATKVDVYSFSFSTFSSLKCRSIKRTILRSLLKKQGDEYLLFVQALVEKGILSLEQIQKEINAYKKSGRFTALDIEAIKSGDIDKIVPVFVNL